MSRKIEFIPPEELFGIPSKSETNKELVEEDVIVEIDKILDWHTSVDIPGVKIHPFNRLSDVKRLELKKSIERNGLMNPIIIRKDVRPGYYELIAGHNRRDLLKELGYQTLSKQKGEVRILEDCSDRVAAYWMFDTNIQREEALPSEKADVYAAKYKLVRDELQENPDLMSHYGTDKRSDEIAAEMMGISRTTLQRYLALKKLLPELMRMVDERKISIPVAELLSSLSADQQAELQTAFEETKVPGLSIAKQIKDACQDRFCTVAELCEIIIPSKSKIDLKPVFRSAAKEFEDWDVAPDQIDNDVLQHIIAEAVKSYLSQFHTGNEN